MIGQVPRWTSRSQSSTPTTRHQLTSPPLPRSKDVLHAARFTKAMSRIYYHTSACLLTSSALLLVEVVAVSLCV